jgi:drug/metabolite transporter (DMT)-like permease
LFHESGISPTQQFNNSILSPTRKAYLQLHTSVVLWGFTAILGRLITLKEIPLVWYRILFTCLALICIPGVFKQVKTTPRRAGFKLAGIGCLVCIHWVCFYGSIKYSNVSISLCCLATTSFMASIIEPLFNRRKIKWYEISLGLFIIPGIILIVHVSQLYITGIILGLLAAFLAATFTVLNKMVVDDHHPQGMTFIELGSGFIFLSIILPVYLHFFPEVNMHPGSTDLFYLLILAVVCTTLPFVLALHALRHLSAFASTLTVNLEPVYGILLAIPFFHENKDLSVLFYFGTAIILLAVFIHPLLKKRFDKELPLR